MHKLLDVIERSAWTFVQTFAALVLSNGLSLDDLKIAAGAPALSVLSNLSIASTVRAGAGLAPARGDAYVRS